MLMFAAMQWVKVTIIIDDDVRIPSFVLIGRADAYCVDGTYGGLFRYAQDLQGSPLRALGAEDDLIAQR